MSWDGLPIHLDAITTPANNIAASLLLLSFAKVSNTEDLLNRQTCHGILCVSTQSPHNRKAHITRRGSTAGGHKYTR